MKPIHVLLVALTAIVFWIFVGLVLLLLVGCGGGEAVRPDIKTNTVLVEKSIPCISEADIPPLPKPTPVDTENASPDQLADASTNDAEVFEKHAKRLDSLLREKCTKLQEPTP